MAHGPIMPGNPMAGRDAAPVAFDLSAHLASLLIHALSEPDKAGAVSWLAAYCRQDTMGVSLARLSTSHDQLGQRPWEAHADPRGLMAILAVFAVQRGPELLTEPQELMGIDWADPDAKFALFAPMADKRPFLVDRAARYLAVTTGWYAAPIPEPGLQRLVAQYAAIYNAGLYQEAFKLLEMRWMIEQEPNKTLLRGLMQLAVGLSQIENGKYALQQLEEAYGRIREARDAFPYPTADRFLTRLEKAVRLIKSYGPERFADFDLKMFPHLWLESPWRQLLRFGRP